MTYEKEQERKDPFAPGRSGIICDTKHSRFGMKVKIIGVRIDELLPVREDCGNMYRVSDEQFFSDELRSSLLKQAAAMRAAQKPGKAVEAYDQILKRMPGDPLVIQERSAALAEREALGKVQPKVSKLQKQQKKRG